MRGGRGPARDGPRDRRQRRRHDRQHVPGPPLLAACQLKAVVVAAGLMLTLLIAPGSAGAAVEIGQLPPTGATVAGCRSATDGSDLPSTPCTPEGSTK